MNLKQAEITGIILAAEKSSRTGQVKQLLCRWAKRPCWIVWWRPAIGSSFSQVIVVLCHFADTIRQVVDFSNVSIVINKEYSMGQNTSLAAGLTAVLETAADAMFIWGNPVIINRSLFSRLATVIGDEGARGLFKEYQTG